MILYTTETNDPEEVNSSKCSHPEPPNLVNYVVACPDHFRHKHAEIILLERFDDLWQSFVQLHTPSLILIFSWIMPCTDCTEAIIAFSRRVAEYQVIVVFKCNCTYNSQWNSREINENNRKKLSQQNNIEIYHVPYADNLPRNDYEDYEDRPDDAWSHRVTQN